MKCEVYARTSSTYFAGLENRFLRLVIVKLTTIVMYEYVLFDFDFVYQFIDVINNDCCKGIWLNGCKSVPKGMPD